MQTDCERVAFARCVEEVPSLNSNERAISSTWIQFLLPAVAFQSFTRRSRSWRRSRGLVGSRFALVRGQIFLPFGRVYIPRLLFFPSLVCDPGNDTYKRMHTHTHTHAFETRRQVVERARYVSSANSFSSACEDKRTVQKATLPLRDTPTGGLSSEGRKGIIMYHEKTQASRFFFFNPVEDALWKISSYVVVRIWEILEVWWYVSQFEFFTEKCSKYH